MCSIYIGNRHLDPPPLLNPSLALLQDVQLGQVAYPRVGETPIKKSRSQLLPKVCFPRTKSKI